MLKWIKKMTNVGQCEEDLEKLVKENEDLKQKLIEKQEQINKTNAFYKKKIYKMKNPDKKNP